MHAEAEPPCWRNILSPLISHHAWQLRGLECDTWGIFLSKTSTGIFNTGRGTTRAKVAQGTPTQSHVSPSILVYEENDVGVILDRIDWVPQVVFLHSGKPCRVQVVVE